MMIANRNRQSVKSKMPSDALGRAGGVMKDGRESFIRRPWGNSRSIADLWDLENLPRIWPPSHDPLL